MSYDTIKCDFCLSDGLIENAFTTHYLHSKLSLPSYVSTQSFCMVHIFTKYIYISPGKWQVQIFIMEQWTGAIKKG